ncbi:type II CAAX endopeptidase family protein [Luteococcus sp. H138]|uniref:CPBP family intramembrane glutamic endopeptidase n=1 Tax=unclassified Luteococcus TaxID=2639923 RepID=UPI00313EA6E5
MILTTDHPARQPRTTPIDADAIRHYRQPGLFFALSTAIPWAMWLAAGRLSHLDAPSHAARLLTSLLGFGGLFAPLVVAAVLTVRNPQLLRDTRHRLTNWRQVNPGLAVLSVVLLPAALLAGTAISLLFGYSPEQFQLRNGFSFTSGVAPAWLVLGLAPIVEELAWHSYGTDALASRWTIWHSSMVFAAIWALWHLPLAGIRGYYQAEVVEVGLLASVNFLVSMFPFMVLMNWLYYRCGRNIWIPVLVHLSANYGNEIFLTHPDTKALQTLLLIALCGWVLWHDRELFFTRPKDRR